MKKRGQVGVQFNWLYVLIAGGLILLFFGSLVLRQKAVSEDKLSVDVLNSLDAIFTGAKVGKGTFNEVSLGQQEMELRCNQYGVGNAQKNLLQTVVFGPSLVRGNKLYTWAVGWEVPYRIMNFLILTSNQVRYVWVSDDTGFSVSRLHEQVPDTLKAERITSTDFLTMEHKNQYKVRFILFDVAPNYMFNPPSDFIDADVSAIGVVAGSTPEKGTLRFFNWVNDGFKVTESSYVETASLFGALYAEDPRDYACGMEKAFERASYVHEINLHRAQYLQDEKYLVDSTCSTLLGAASSSLLTLANHTSLTEAAMITTASNTLRQTNQELIQNSCVLIY
jgi:hypothetical protein